MSWVQESKEGAGSLNLPAVEELRSMINRFNSSLLERKLSSQHDAVQPDSADTPAQFLRPRPPQAQPTGGADGPITAGRNSSDSLNKLRHSRGPLLSDLQSALHHQHGQEHDQQHAQEKGGVQAPQAAARPASPCPLSPSRPGSSTGASSRRLSHSRTSNSQGGNGPPCTIAANMAALHETLTSLGVPLDASAGRSTGAPAPGKTPAAAGWGAGGGAGPRSGLASGDVSGDAPQALAAITARLQRSFAHLDSIGSKLQESSLRRATGSSGASRQGSGSSLAAHGSASFAAALREPSGLGPLQANAPYAMINGQRQSSRSLGSHHGTHLPAAEPCGSSGQPLPERQQHQQWANPAFSASDGPHSAASTPASTPQRHATRQQISAPQQQQRQQPASGNLYQQQHQPRGGSSIHADVSIHGSASSSRADAPFSARLSAAGLSAAGSQQTEAAVHEAGPQLQQLQGQNRQLQNMLEESRLVSAALNKELLAVKAAMASAAPLDVAALLEEKERLTRELHAREQSAASVLRQLLSRNQTGTDGQNAQLMQQVQELSQQLQARDSALTAAEQRLRRLERMTGHHAASVSGSSSVSGSGAPSEERMAATRGDLNGAAVGAAAAQHQQQAQLAALQEQLEARSREVHSLRELLDQQQQQQQRAGTPASLVCQPSGASSWRPSSSGGARATPAPSPGPLRCLPADLDKSLEALAAKSAEVAELRRQLRAVGERHQAELATAEAAAARRLALQQRLLEAAQMEVDIRNQELVQLQAAVATAAADRQQLSLHAAEAGQLRERLAGATEDAAAANALQQQLKERDEEVAQLHQYLAGLYALVASPEWQSQQQQEEQPAGPHNLAEQLQARVRELLARVTSQEAELQLAAQQAAGAAVAAAHAADGTGACHTAAETAQGVAAEQAALVQQLRIECQRLQREQSDTEASNDALLAELTGAADKLVAAEQQLQKLAAVRSHNQLLQEQLAAVRSHNQLLQEQLAVAQQEQQRMRQLLQQQQPLGMLSNGSDWGSAASPEPHSPTHQQQLVRRLQQQLASAAVELQQGHPQLQQQQQQQPVLQDAAAEQAQRHQQLLRAAARAITSLLQQVEALQQEAQRTRAASPRAAGEAAAASGALQQQRLRQLEGQLSESDTEVSRLHAVNARLQERVAELELQAAAVTTGDITASEAWAQQCHQLSARLRQVEGQLEQQQLQAEARMRRATEALQQQVSSLQHQVLEQQQQQQQRKQLQRRLSQEQHKQQLVEAQQQQAGVRVPAGRLTACELWSRCQTLQQQVEQLQAQLLAAQQEVQRAQQQAGEQQQQVVRVEQLVRDQQGELEQWQTHAEALEEDLQEAKLQLAAAEAAAATAASLHMRTPPPNRPASAATANRAASPGAAALWDSEKARMRAGLAEQEHVLQQRAAELAAAGTELDKLRAAVAFLEDALATSNADYERLQSQHQALQGEAAAARERAADSLCRLEDATGPAGPHARLRHAEQLALQAQRRAEASEQLAAAASAERDGLAAALQEREEQLTMLEGQLGVLEQEVRHIKQQEGYGRP